MAKVSYDAPVDRRICKIGDALPRKLSFVVVDRDPDGFVARAARKPYDLVEQGQIRGSGPERSPMRPSLPCAVFVGWGVGLPAIAVIKGQVGPPDKDPFRVDGMSGATITSNAITRLTRFWLSDDGYGKFLKRFRERGPA